MRPTPPPEVLSTPAAQRGAPVTIRVGSVFGRLTVIATGLHRRDPCGRVARLVVVRCACGTEHVVRVGNLLAGTTRSCGCLASEVASAQMTARRRAQRERALIVPTWNRRQILRPRHDDT